MLNISSKLFSVFVAACMLSACGSGGNSPTPAVTPTPTPGGWIVPDSPSCVWNEAYIENGSGDSVANAVVNAQNCYVLIDTLQGTNYDTEIAALRSNGNTVSCYISVGTCEDWRDDFSAVQPYCTSEQWPEWPGEYYVDKADTGVLDVMKSRIDKMAASGCDMVEFDNMDWALDSETRATFSLSVTEAEVRTYNNALCDYTHEKGMGCMAKNTRDGASNFDGGTFESYPSEKNWWDTSHLQGFLDAGQFGFIVHYDEFDCDGVYAEYVNTYGSSLSFLCSDGSSYKH